jgi:hypothetical protein
MRFPRHEGDLLLISSPGVSYCKGKWLITKPILLMSLFIFAMSEFTSYIPEKLSQSKQE